MPGLGGRRQFGSIQDLKLRRSGADAKLDPVALLAGPSQTISTGAGINQARDSPV